MTGMARWQALSALLLIAILAQACTSGGLLVDAYRGKKALDEGRYADAEKHRAEQIKAAEKFGPDNILLAQGLDELAAVYFVQGRYAEAEPLFKRALAIVEKVKGPEHPDVALALANLATVYEAQGRYADAEPPYVRALAIWEKAKGPEHPDTVPGLQWLGMLYYTQGRYAEAEPLLKRTLAIWEKAKGPEHPDIAALLQKVAGIKTDQGRYAEAEPLLKRALAIWEKAKGPEHPDVAPEINNLAALYYQQGRYAEAEPLLKRALAIWEKAKGPEHRDSAGSLNNLGELYVTQGKYIEAESLLKRALAIREKTLGPEHPDVAYTINNLARLYLIQAQYTQAEPLQQRALAIWEKTLGPEHPNVAISLNNLGFLSFGLGDHAQAEAFHRRALSIREKTLGPEHPDVAQSLNNLAQLHYDRGQLAEAEPLWQRALMIYEKALGPQHPDVALSLNNLAWLYLTEGRFTNAEPLARRALAIWEKALGVEHPRVAVILGNLGAIVAKQGRAPEARDLFERARRNRLAIARLNLELDEEALRGLLKEGQSSLVNYVALLAAIARDPTLDPSAASPALDAFVVAEQARSGAAQAALARAGARAAAGDPATAELARQVQEMRQQRQALQKQAIEEHSKPSALRVPNRLEQLRDRGRQLDADLANAGERLNRAFPQYAELAGPEPIEVGAVQRLLRPDEALVSFFTLEFDNVVLVWLVRPGQTPVFHIIDIKRSDLSKQVNQVRSSLDQSVNPDLPIGRLAPLDVAGAHKLYTLLLEPLRPQWAGVKHLIVVPDDVLLPLPFAALVTRAEGEAYRTLSELYATQRSPSPQELPLYATLPWLAREVALTVLPSATSLRALRHLQRPAAAESDPFLGIGDPLLQGVGRERGGAMLATRGVRVVPDDLRRLNRLPGTRDELLAVARALGADPQRALHLGSQATEPIIRELNRSGRLGRARVVAFATHGLLAGQVKGLTQPALVLTPPATASEEDDGLLSLDEILELKLTQTDRVLLSACNTGGADGSGEGLSGLARAFFFAGARALLVSHWSVDDQATQALMTEVFRRAAADPTLPRAEALRQGMLALMAQAKGPTAYFAHPFAWAAFFLVGDGGATK